MSDRDDADRLRRLAEDDARDTAAWQTGQAQGAPSFLARTKVVTTYPTVANVYYAVESQTITGSEVEGGAMTMTTGGDTSYAYNLGGAIPPQGTPVLVTFTDFRQVFRYG